MAIIEFIDARDYRNTPLCQQLRLGSRNKNAWTYTQFKWPHRCDTQNVLKRFPACAAGNRIVKTYGS